MLWPEVVVTQTSNLALCTCIAYRKYIRRDTGDTSKLRNADTLFDELDNILSVSCLRPPLI